MSLTKFMHSHQGLLSYGNGKMEGENLKLCTKIGGAGNGEERVYPQPCSQGLFPRWVVERRGDLGMSHRAHRALEMREGATPKGSSLE